jgi:hypothetical protein
VKPGVGSAWRIVPHAVVERFVGTSAMCGKVLLGSVSSSVAPNRIGVPPIIRSCISLMFSPITSWDEPSFRGILLSPAEPAVAGEVTLDIGSNPIRPLALPLAFEQRAISPAFGVLIVIAIPAVPHERMAYDRSGTRSAGTTHRRSRRRGNPTSRLVCAGFD